MRFEEEVMNKLKSIEIRYYVAFFSALICGLGAHLYQFTNKSFNYDELGQTPAGYGTQIELGRWGLWMIEKTVGALFRTYSLPFINGMTTLILVALSTCLLVKAFDIRDKICCALIGGCFVVLPALVSTFFFMFTSTCYGIGMFCACLSGLELTTGVKILENSKKADLSGILKIVAGLLLFEFSLGIYQTNCAIALGILLIDIMLGLYDTKESDEWKLLLRRGIVYCGMFGVGVLCYVSIMNFFCVVSGTPLSGYRGIDSIGTINLGMTFFSVIRTFEDYIALMTSKDVYQINPTIPVRVVFIIINVVVLLLVVNRLRKKDSLMIHIGLVATVLLMPIVIFFPEILLQSGGSYAIMFMSSIYIFVTPLVLYDRYVRTLYDKRENKGKGKKDYIGRVLCISLFCNVLVYIWFANGNYQALQYTTYHDLAYFETLATQIKSLDGYTPDLKVALVGDGFDDPTFRAGGLMDEYFDIGGKFDTNINYFDNVYLWTRYLGFTPEVIEFRESGYLSDMDEVKAMPCYPVDGSIAIIGDTVVIKASE